MNLSKTLPLFLILACLVSACGKSSTTSSNDAESSRIALAQSDADQFKNFNSGGGQAVDQAFNQTFTKIFGGNDAASVQRYFNDRVHHFVDSKKISFLADGKETNTNWLNGPSAQSGANPSPTPDITNEIQALNITTPLWLDGLVNGIHIELKDGNGNTYPIDSTRSGIVELGAAYLTTIQSDSGQTYPIPVEARQAILVHEARHSDCTGGFSGAQLTELQNVTDSDDFVAKFPLMNCGHLHQKCAAGDYAGIEACDGEAFGAYTMGAIYALAGMHNNTDEVAVQILRANFFDYLSRVQNNIDMHAVLTGQIAITPDMTSDGFHP